MFGEVGESDPVCASVNAEIIDLNQYCSLKKNSVRPELVEGCLMSSWWFDKALLSVVEGVTTNGKANSIET